MKTKLIDIQAKKITVNITDTKPYFVNAIRRTMIGDLPKLAVEDVIIYDNTSALFDEIITHRLGLIPIPTDLKILNFKDECICKGKGCPSCTVRYTLSKEGEGVVCSGDLQPEEKSWAITEDKIPIVELFNDQRLILEIEAILGTSRKHAKWQPVQAPGYRFMPTAEYEPSKKKEVEKFIKSLPDGIAAFKNDKIEILDITKMPIFESYLDRKKITYITVKRDQTNIVFSFETDGSLSAKSAFIHTCKILEDKYKELGKQLKNLK